MTMKKALLLLAIIISSCDEVDQPLENEFGFLPFPESTNKRVLVEDFTGVKCNNCPEAAEKAKTYEEQNPGQVVILGIHAGNFAVPGEKHPIDFRTKEGRELFQFFNPIGVPSGMFDRTGYPDDEHSKLLGEWDKTMNQRLGAPAPCEIRPILTYENSNKTFSLKVSVAFLENVETEIFLSTFLAEDSIIGPQTMPDGSINKSYVHNHVLRASFNGIFGESLIVGPKNGDIAQKNMALSSQNSQWIIKNCSAIIFVYDRSTYEVLQAHHAELE